jgi:DNA-binding NarL/FixJ family response regulator
MAGMIRVLLADEETLFRLLLADYLSRQDGIEVAGEAADGQAAVDLALQLKPEVVLLDVALPVVCGEVVVSQIRKQSSEIRIIVLTRQSDADVVRSLLSAGADGYLLKTEAPEILLRAIDVVRRCACQSPSTHECRTVA